MTKTLPLPPREAEGAEGGWGQFVATAFLSLPPRSGGRWPKAGGGQFVATMLITLAQFSSPLFAAEPFVHLPQHLEQGQLVIGHALPGTHLAFDGHKLRIGADGTFVFGLARDAPPQVELDVRDAEGHSSMLTLDVAQRTYPTERVNGLPQQTVTPNPQILARIQREQASVQIARARDDTREDFLHGFALPVQGARISGVYGSQRFDNGVPKAPHMGLDMAVPAGTPVHAPAAGIVTFVATDLFLTGGTVLIDHGFGLDSSFLHMSRVDVKIGDHVKRGQVIGAAGMTGRATGPHVHWGFNWFDVRLDPALLLKPSS